MIRQAFVDRFGEAEAARIEAAANEHKNGVHDRTGSDPFRWALIICIGHECFTKDSFREYHGIVASTEELKNWIKSEAHLEDHDGDVDYLAMFVGVYNEYMPPKAVEA